MVLSSLIVLLQSIIFSATGGAATCSNTDNVNIYEFDAATDTFQFGSGVLFETQSVGNGTSNTDYAGFSLHYLNTGGNAKVGAVYPTGNAYNNSFTYYVANYIQLNSFLNLSSVSSTYTSNIANINFSSTFSHYTDGNAFYITNNFSYLVTETYNFSIVHNAYAYVASSLIDNTSAYFGYYGNSYNVNFMMPQLNTTVNYLSYVASIPYRTTSFNTFDYLYYLDVFTITYFDVSSIDADAYNRGYQAGWTHGQESGYTDGYNQGSADGYNLGYGDAYQVGYQVGYAQGLTDGNANLDIMNIMSAIIDTPILIVRSLFDYELFGTSLYVSLLSLITLVIVIWVVRKFI